MFMPGVWFLWSKKKKSFSKKRKWKYFYTFNHSFRENSSKRANSTNHPAWPPFCRNKPAITSAYVVYEWSHSDWKVNEATMKHWNRSVQWLRIIYKGQIFTIFTSLKFQCTSGNQMHLNNVLFIVRCRVSIQRVKSLGGHFSCLCRGFDFYEVKKNCVFQKVKVWNLITNLVKSIQ